MSEAREARPIETLLPQNPWKALEGELPAELAPPRARSAVDGLLERLLRPEPGPLPLLLGPRYAGKTTAMHQVVAGLIARGVSRRRIWWMRLDHPAFSQLQLEELIQGSGILRGASADDPVYLFLDEVTWARDWDAGLRSIRSAGLPVRALATSSSRSIHKDRPIAAGKGHWEEFYFPPVLFSEFLRERGVHGDEQIEPTFGQTLESELSELQPERAQSSLLRRFLLLGAFPALLRAGAPEDEASAVLWAQRELRSMSVQPAVYRDVPQAFGVQEAQKVERLLHILASHSSDVLSPTRLAGELGVSQPTVDKYIAYLQRAFLAFTLSNYSSGEESTIDLGGPVQRRGRKVFFVDGALRNAVLERGLGPMRDDWEVARLRENAAATHLHSLAQQTGAHLFHWRKARMNVSLIYDHPMDPIAFEVGGSPMHDTRGLREFQQRFPRFAGRCYLVSPGAVPAPASDSAGGIGRISLSSLLRLAGAQAQAALNRRLLSS